MEIKVAVETANLKELIDQELGFFNQEGKIAEEDEDESESNQS